MLRRKWESYRTRVEKFNASYPEHQLTDYPTLEDVKEYPLEHNFWSIGSLTHPDEAWATDPLVQQGIQSWLTLQRCDEELRRIAREVRQLLQSALISKRKLDELLDLTERGVFHLIHFVLKDV